MSSVSRCIMYKKLIKFYSAVHHSWLLDQFSPVFQLVTLLLNLTSRISLLTSRISLEISLNEDMRTKIHNTVLCTCTCTYVSYIFTRRRESATNFCTLKLFCVEMIHTCTALHSGALTTWCRLNWQREGQMKQSRS